jgi:hypothetical protein
MTHSEDPKEQSTANSDRSLLSYLEDKFVSIVGKYLVTVPGRIKQSSTRPSSEMAQLLVVLYVNHSVSSTLLYYLNTNYPFYVLVGVFLSLNNLY